VTDILHHYNDGMVERLIVQSAVKQELLSNTCRPLQRQI